MKVLGSSYSFLQFLIFSRSSSILHIDPIDFAKGTPLEDFFEGLALRDSSYRYLIIFFFPKNSSRMIFHPMSLWHGCYLWLRWPFQLLTNVGKDIYKHPFHSQISWQIRPAPFSGLSPLRIIIIIITFIITLSEEIPTSFFQDCPHCRCSPPLSDRSIRRILFGHWRRFYQVGWAFFMMVIIIVTLFFSPCFILGLSLWVEKMILMTMTWWPESPSYF